MPSGRDVSVNNFAFVVHYVCDQFGELPDRDVFARPDIEELDSGIMLHNKNASIGNIIGINKFSPRRTRSPNCDGGRIG